MRVKGHDWMVFYITRHDHIDVWRVLHGARNIGGVLDDPGEGAEH
jgi:plasmid stabilization system protein ParE